MQGMAKGTGHMPAERWRYDVFLNFRGADVRGGFLSHLYSSLRRFNVRTFMDEVVLERGDYIPSELLDAIENSKILVVILSKDYASSSWCLDELLQIMKCRRSNSRQLVFPVFYYIDPSDIRRQKGTLANSFANHETRYPLKQVQSWREALTEVANLSGWDLKQWDEAKCIEVVTKDILKRLPSSYLHVPSYAVGMESRLQHIYELLSTGSEDVQVIGIYGMGGTGKTMLAKAAYNEFAWLFEGTSFLENFREHSKKPDDGKADVQKQLLSDILKSHEKDSSGFDFAVNERFRNKRVLVVIDDVDDISQLNSVAIDSNWPFGPGSRIIVTTRNTHLLKQIGVEGRYSPKELDGGESLELLSWHAFRKSEPPTEYLWFAKKIVKYCAGLPLALEVFGSFLFGRSITDWEGTLGLLKQSFDDNIEAKLRISFDALNSLQKDIFLDVACFFIGMDRDYVACILEGCNLCPEIGLSVLLERCLITVNDSRLMMHDLLRDMGRQIVRQISPKNCGKRSRLWDLDDVLDVLTKKSGTDAIEGLSLKAEINDPKEFEAAALSNMQELRLLQLSYVNLRGSYEHLPKGLRWLRWHGFPLESLPTNFYLGFLVVMDMQHSNLRQLWDAQEPPQPLRKLKYLNLSHSDHLVETPDFSYLPNLEKLLLKNCKSLVRVHESIGMLHKKLVLVNMNGCSKLNDLPREFYRLKSLETLIISGCSNFKMLDDSLGELESLTSLIVDDTSLRVVPSSIIQLKKLKELSLRGCRGSLDGFDDMHSEYNPPIVLSSLVSNGLNCLMTLCLGYCNLSDQSLPDDLGCLACLEELDLQGNKFYNLKTDFSTLPNLKKLWLNACSTLQSMRSLPKSLREFNASGCISLVRTPDFSECSCLETLYLTNCYNLVETPGIDKLTRSKRISIYMNFCKRALDASGDSILQGWVERGNGAIYIPGSNFPDWVSFKDETNSVCFTVPETRNVDPVGFTVWMRMMSHRDDGNPPTITVKNQTNGNVWPRDDLNEYFRLERGDQVEVNVGCSEQGTVFETGIALRYSKRDSLDISNGEAEEDELKQTEEILYFCGNNVVMYCKREKIKARTLRTIVFTSHSRQREGKAVHEELYVCGVFLETSTSLSRNRRNTQLSTQETHHSPPSPRKMRVGSRTLAGFLEFCHSLLWDNYGEQLRRRRLRRITGGKFIR
ncbi:Disease resistance protein RUN1 [Cardamine amara subsp. amara]|uniref:Disease resistance protein RUN1 n=1 Tax=Cardamine amara subsp. amara TaxID=228776 RepID=A0ABD1BA94_CARAN